MADAQAQLQPARPDSRLNHASRAALRQKPEVMPAPVRARHITLGSCFVSKPARRYRGAHVTASKNEHFQLRLA